VKSAAGVVLDAGAFIALECRNRTMVALAELLAKAETPLVTSAGVVAQVWRSGSHQQVPIAYLLRRTQVVALDHAVARTLGRILGQTGTSDLIDAHIVLLARERGWPILSSDAADLLAIDPSVVVERI
jgi:PIN domain nuclease of toxin-antitoxin system